MIARQVCHQTRELVIAKYQARTLHSQISSVRKMQRGLYQWPLCNHKSCLVILQPTTTSTQQMVTMRHKMFVIIAFQLEIYHILHQTKDDPSKLSISIQIQIFRHEKKSRDDHEKKSKKKKHKKSR